MYLVYFFVCLPMDAMAFLFLLFLRPERLYTPDRMKHFQHDGYVHGEIWTYKFSLEGKLLSLFSREV